MSTVKDLSPDERRAYELITSEDGLHQSELWKVLDVTSRTGSRLAHSLAEKGLIERQETVHDSRTTYLLKPATNGTPTNGSTPYGNDAEPDANVVDTEELTPLEQRALSLIQEHNGRYQSDLWKELDVSSRTGSRIATSLVEQDYIEREETTHNSRNTYFLTPTPRELDFSLLMAGDVISPLISAEETVDPIESDAFTQWLLTLTRDKH